ncbi:MAG: hypothetical protein EAZ47_10830 [Bacteroidetes bacterium]|nr:MAG: hypothetical protein EAY72_06455 [Bacteroidota bacterium]TAE68977.1 MAG: hypothetical protein EAY68_04100 [Bacteroidota bacterium]TAF90737.1 MAG: hypothetical protein EAZ47_10830 [Bacteroidota bacterium]
MSDEQLAIIVLVIAIFLGFGAYYYFQDKKRGLVGSAAVPVGAPNAVQASVLPLQLQAHERLVLLVERISLHNLVSRLYNPDFSSGVFRQVLASTVKEEFEHNITQQLYVSATVWQAVEQLKDNTLTYINQVSRLVDANTPATQLSKQLLTVAHETELEQLAKTIKEIISAEAKKLMQ